MTGDDDNGENDALEECLCGMMRWSVGLLLLLLLLLLPVLTVVEAEEGGEAKKEGGTEEVAGEDVAAVGWGIVVLVQRRCE